MAVCLAVRSRLAVTFPFNLFREVFGLSAGNRPSACPAPTREFDAARSGKMLATLVTALGASSSDRPLDPDRPLDLMCVDDAFPPALSSMGFSLYEFTGGEKGTTIGDGGNDMYDGGNEIRLRVNGQWTDALKYTQQCTGAVSEPAGKGDAMYATCKTSGSDPLFSAVFRSVGGAIDGLRISGNLGADGRGRQASSARPLVTKVPDADKPPDKPLQSPVYGYFKAVYHAASSDASYVADPSINHLILARSDSGLQTIGSTTDTG